MPGISSGPDGLKTLTLPEIPNLLEIHHLLEIRNSLEILNLSETFLTCVFHLGFIIISTLAWEY